MRFILAIYSTVRKKEARDKERFNKPKELSIEGISSGGVGRLHDFGLPLSSKTPLKVNLILITFYSFRLNLTNIMIDLLQKLKSFQFV